MRWFKRLKWLRISKIVIPIALAISLVFVGVAVYGTEAQNFIIQTTAEEGLSLMLSYTKNVDTLSTNLVVPIDKKFVDATFNPNYYEDGYTDPDFQFPVDDKYAQNDNRYINAIPNDVALNDGINYGLTDEGNVTYMAIGFYLYNNSEYITDVDMRFNLDAVAYNGNTSGSHVDDALRVMIVEGEDVLLSSGDFTVYKKAESAQEKDDHFLNKIANRTLYLNNLESFMSSNIIFERVNEDRFTLQPAQWHKFTVVLWIEGEDADCIDAIFGERMKMSIDFYGN